MSLSITARAGSAIQANADVLVVGVFADPAGGEAAVTKGKAAPMLSGDLAAYEKVLPGLLTLLAKDEFTGKKDQSAHVVTYGKLGVPRVLFLGLGERDKLTPHDVRTFAAKAARAANADKAKALALAVPDAALGHARSLAEGLELGAYRFTKYLTGERVPKASLASVVIFGSAGVDKKGLAHGQAVAAGVNLARDLSNEPPNKLYPETLAQEAQRVAKKFNLGIKVFDHKEIVRRGMELIDAVGRGSRREPRLVHMSYVPKGKPKKRLVFVGKGITFDTGGISIKPAAAMHEMKHDMSGSANVVGLMAAVGATKPDCEVHGIFAAAENMPDGNAYRPGDVFGSLDGKTVEILNTDAEGRLVLADALAYARELAPDLLVDNATLTGACVVALGTTCSGFYANTDEAAQDFAAATKAAGEQMWRMPLLDELRDQLKSDAADLKNIGDRYGGSITAALFLREFIGQTKHWVHADIAGPAMSDRVSGIVPKGGTGHGVMTFLALVEAAERGDLASVRGATTEKGAKPNGGKARGRKAT